MLSKAKCLENKSVGESKEEVISAHAQVGAQLDLKQRSIKLKLQCSKSGQVTNAEFEMAACQFQFLS